MWSWVKSWRKSLSRWTDARLQVVQQICMQEAGQTERAASRTRAWAWKDWASTGMADGARLAHRWIKVVAKWADASVDANGLAVQPQEPADLVAKEWHDLWKVGRACQIDFWGANSAPCVPTPSPDDPRDVCGSFSAHTATGSDNLHRALHLKHVCDDALRTIAMILTLASNIGYCPAVFATIILVLSPKATGGCRPIGLFTSVLWVCLRWTRRAVTSSWERDFSRPHWFGQTPHTCQHATWRLSMAGEFATSVGFSAALALIDLAKALEHIQFPNLWRMVDETRLPAAPPAVPGWRVRRA